MVLELKSLPYFDEINWKEVAERTNEPPFEPIQSEQNENNLLNVTHFAHNGDYDELELRFLPKFASELDKKYGCKCKLFNFIFNCRLYLCGTRTSELMAFTNFIEDVE